MKFATIPTRLLLVLVALLAASVGMMADAPPRAEAACGNQSMINNAEPTVNLGQQISFLDGGCSGTIEWYLYDSSQNVGYQPVQSGGTEYQFNSADHPLHYPSPGDGYYYAVDVCDTTSCAPSGFAFSVYPKIDPSSASIYQGAAPDSYANGTKDARFYLETKTSGTVLPGPDCGLNDNFWGSIDDKDYTANWYQIGFSNFHSDSAGNYSLGINSCGTQNSETGMVAFVQSTQPSGNITCFIGYETPGAQGQSDAGCQADIADFGITNGQIVEYQFTQADSCHIQANVNGRAFAEMNDCSISSGWYVDGSGEYLTGVIEEANNDGTTNTGDASYAGNVFSYRDHQANFNYVDPASGVVYSSDMHKVAAGCPGATNEAPNFGTALNYSSHFYEFQTGTFQGSGVC